MTTTMERPLSHLSGLPAYIRVVGSNVGNPVAIPEILHYDVPLPDGSLARPLHEQNTVSRTTIPRLAVATVVIQHVDAERPVNWCFRGLYFPGVPPFTLYGAGSQLTSPALHWGPRPGQPRGIIFNQCAWDLDPTGQGRASGSRILFHEGSYIGIFNSYATNGYGLTGNEQNLITATGEGPGPYEWSNNEFRVPGTFYDWCGGGQHASVGTVPSNWMTTRNWIYYPMSWRPSELNPRTLIFGGQWAALVSANRTTVSRDGTYNQRGWEADGPDGVQIGCTMVDPATGVARRIIAGQNTTAPGGPVFLESPGWPGTDTGRIVVYFQRTALVLYNSGWDTPGVTPNDGPTATTEAGSPTVQFSEPLPPQVKSRADHGGGDNPGHFFYLNNTYPVGGQTTSVGQGPLVGTDDGLGGLATYPLRNDWTWESGMTPATARRKEILSIAPDRLSCTLGHPTSDTPSGYFESRTFPYSIVWGDGLVRDATQYSKGQWEFKTGRRMLHQGNVLETWLGTQHPTDQVNVTLGASTHVNGTIDGDLFTYTGPGTESNLAGFAQWADERATFGHPWPSKIAVPRDTWVTELWSQGRRPKRVLPGNLTMALHPPEPGLQPGSQPTALTNAKFVRISVWNPGNQVEHTVLRYNVFVDDFHLSTFTGQENPGEVTKGLGARTHHDNVLIDTGRRVGYFVGLRGLFNIPTTPWAARPGHGNVPGDNGNLSITHNTMVKAVQRQGASVLFKMFSDAAGTFFKKATDLDISANIFHDLSETTSIFGVEAYAVRDTRLDWGEPARSDRNVYVGAGAQNALSAAASTGAGSAYRDRFPDNAAIPTADGVGFADLTHADRYRLENYRLVDVVPVGTGGTVTIAADGVTVTKDSGTFPAGLAQGGPFFKTSTHAALRRILPPPTGLRSTWVAVAGVGTLTQSGGLLTLVSSFGVMRHTQSLPTTQWAEAKIPTLPSATSAAVCLALTGNTYLFLQAIRPGVTNQNLEVFSVFNGTPSGSPRFALTNGATPGSTMRLETDGTTFWVYLDNVLQGSGSASSFSGGGSAGVRLQSISGTLTGVTLDDFKCGSGTTLTDDRVELAADDFSPQQITTTFTLASSYPEIGAGKSYAITFKGTAADGRDPGADIDLVALMTRGVKKRPA